MYLFIMINLQIKKIIKPQLEKKFGTAKKYVNYVY